MLPLFASIAAAALIIAIIEWLRRYQPSTYFAMSELVHGIDDKIGTSALSLRFAIPFTVGSAVGLIVPEDAALIGGTAGGLAACFLVWPALLRPELVYTPSGSRLRELRTMYLLFVAAYAILGLGGAALGSFVRDILRPLADDAAGSTVAGVARDELPTLVRGVIATLVAWPIVALFQRMLRGRSRP